MDFEIKRPEQKSKLPTDDADFKLAKKFADLLSKEMKDFLKSIVLFGSTAKQVKTVHEKDIDVLILVDDLVAILTPEVVEAYRIITEKTASQTSKRLHITTMKLTNFWDYVRNGDPIVTNMLRDGYPLFDTGVFEPAQRLLAEGRIKPTKESIWAYYTRAPTTIQGADWHIMQAVLDLYWAVIDSAHAALMTHGVVPPAPDLIAEEIKKVLVRTNLVKMYYVKEMDFFYTLSKKITHREVQRITGKEFEDYRNRAIDFVKTMQKIVRG
ncbi:nucleotidyltransferase domain-containing protein [Candidatus Woesearchaeota archaeon]|nr:nucleotidyltransferase domain-containing protein [Candidatus Woesearchaeota archaeon]